MIVISECPICQGTDFKNEVLTKDLTVSGEEFPVKQCSKCGLRITSPRPDENDLGKYYQSQEYISHTGKANNLVNSVYLIARKFTLSWKCSIVRKYSTGTKLLDYGCGTGEFLHYCKEQNFDISGVEPADSARQKAKSLNNTKEIASSINEVKGTKNVITLWHVLEHVSDLNETLEKLRDKLENEGIIIIAVPNPNSWDSSNYGNIWAAYDTPRHLWHFSQKSMALLIENHRMKLIETIPMKLDSYYISLMSEKNKNSKLGLAGMINAVLNGLKSNLNAAKNKEYSSLIYIIKK